MIILFILAVIDYVANTINANTRIKIINKIMIANVSTKINTGIGIVVVNSRSQNNTSISSSVNDMSIDNIIVSISILASTSTRLLIRFEGLSSTYRIPQ